MTPNNDSICFALGIKDSNLILMDYFYAFINLAKGTRKKLQPDIRKCRIYEFKLRNQLITCPNCHHRRQESGCILLFHTYISFTICSLFLNYTPKGYPSSMQ